MQVSDDFSTYHEELLDGRYDCVDRIVLNGYFSLGQQGGGFRTWWRQLTGSDETLDQGHLQRMAGRFSRRIHAWARKVGVPLIHCAAGVRKHELAQRHLPQDPEHRGLFLILVAKAPGLVREVKPRAIRILAGLLTLREKVIKPVLAGLGKPRPGRPPKDIDPLDQHYVNLQREMHRTFQTLGLAA